MIEKLKEDKFFARILAIIIGVGHLVALFSFGATFWVDSVLYLDLAYFLTKGSGLLNFYTPMNMCIASHFPLLPAALWSGLYLLLHDWTWIGIAFLQHLVAGLALFYLIRSLKRYVAPAQLIVATTVLLLLPFYQSFHNMVMTESLASSLLLVMVASTIYLTFTKNPKRHLLVFILASIIGIQARPQIILFALGLLVIQFAIVRKYLVKYFIVGTLAIIGAYYLFPGLRAIMTGKFFMPNIDCLGVRSALMSYMGKNEGTADILTQAKYRLPSDISPQQVADSGMTYEQALHWKSALVMEGLSEEKTNTILKEATTAVRYSSVEGVESQLDTALSGVGVINFSIFHRPTQVLSEGLTQVEWSKHYMEHYRWLSWVSEADHHEIFADFINRFTVSGWYPDKVIKMMKDSISPFISPYFSLRDPLWLSKIPPDFWGIGWILGVILLFLSKRRTLAIVMATPAFLNYCVVLFVGFGNIRYFYLVMPIAVVITVVGMFGWGSQIRKLWRLRIKSMLN